MSVIKAHSSYMHPHNFEAMRLLFMTQLENMKWHTFYVRLLIQSLAVVDYLRG